MMGGGGGGRLLDGMVGARRKMVLWPLPETKHLFVNNIRKYQAFETESREKFATITFHFCTKEKSLKNLKNSAHNSQPRPQNC